MAKYFAQLNSSNTVTNIITLDDMSHKHKVALSPDSQWVQTFIGGKRGNFAGIGMTYAQNVATMGVGSTDIFVSQQPYASWGIGKTTADWISPLPQPGLTTTQSANGQCYQWDEVAHQADSATPKTVGWALTSR